MHGLCLENVTYDTSDRAFTKWGQEHLFCAVWWHQVPSLEQWADTGEKEVSPCRKRKATDISVLILFFPQLSLPHSHSWRSAPAPPPPSNPLTACQGTWSLRAAISQPSMPAPANYSGVLTWKSHGREVGAKRIGPCPKSRSLVPTLSLFHSLDDLLQVTISLLGLDLFVCKMGITPVFNNHFPCNPGANNLACQSLGVFTYKMGLILITRLTELLCVFVAVKTRIGRQTFSIKGQTLNICSFAGQMTSVAATDLPACSTKVALDKM